MKGKKQAATATAGKLQFLYWISALSDGEAIKEWIVMDCPEEVTDAEQADAYLEANMREMMNDNCWDIVNNYKPIEIGYNLKTPAQKEKEATEAREQKVQAKKEAAITRVINDGLQDKELEFDVATAALVFAPAGLVKQEIQLFDLAKSIIGDRVSERGRFEGSPNTIFSIDNEAGENIMHVTDVETYRNLASQVTLWTKEGERKQLMHDIKVNKMKDLLMSHEFDKLSKEKQEKFHKDFEELAEINYSKGHINYYRANHVGVVYNGFGISLNPSALYKQLCMNKNVLDSKIISNIKDVKALPSKKENEE